MAASQILAIGLSVVIGGFILLLLGELYYLLCWRRRPITNARVNSIAQDLLVSVEGGEMEVNLDVAFTGTCGGYQVSALHADIVNKHAELVEKLFPLAFNADTEGIPLHTLLGPPRMLFTIKEETKEDLEGITFDNKSMWRSTEKSLDSLQLSLDTVISPTDSPYITPPSSPPSTSPDKTPPITPLSSLQTLSPTCTLPFFSPSFECFNTPLDSIPPIGFGVGLLPPSVGGFLEQAFSSTPPIPSSPTASILLSSSPKTSCRAPSPSRSPFLALASPKSPFLLPPSSNSHILATASPKTSLLVSSSPQTPFFVTTPRSPKEDLSNTTSSSPPVMTFCTSFGPKKGPLSPSQPSSGHSPLYAAM